MLQQPPPAHIHTSYHECEVSTSCLNPFISYVIQPNWETTCIQYIDGSIGICKWLRVAGGRSISLGIQHHLLWLPCLCVSLYDILRIPPTYLRYLVVSAYTSYDTAISRWSDFHLLYHLISDVTFGGKIGFRKVLSMLC